MPPRASPELTLQIKEFPLGKRHTATGWTHRLGHLLIGAVHLMPLKRGNSMAWLTGNERVFLRAVSHLGYSNPFLPERITYEREALGAHFVEAEAVWNMQMDQPDAPLTNNTNIMARAESLVPQLRARLAKGVAASAQDLLLYEDVVLFVLFHRYRTDFDEVIGRAVSLKRTRQRC